MALNHIFVSGKSAAPDTTVADGPNWDADHVLSGGNLGALVYQGTAGAPTLINSVAVGQALVSAGAAAVPVWSAALTLGDGLAATPTYSYASNPDTGDWLTGSTIVRAINAAPLYGWSAAATRINAGVALEWSTDVGVAGDIALSRAAANRLRLATGDVFNLQPTAFASLPTGAEGDIAYVTDSNTATWGATIAGGGANNVLATFNGTNWTVAGA